MAVKKFTQLYGFMTPVLFQKEDGMDLFRKEKYTLDVLLTVLIYKNTKYLELCFGTRKKRAYYFTVCYYKYSF